MTADRRWTDPPTPDIWAAVVTSAAYAADHDDARSAATLTDSGLDSTALAIAAIDHAVMAAAISGQAIASVAGPDAPQVFERLRGAS